MTLHVYIGHDDREQEAYDVCAFSLQRRASEPVVIHPLKHRDLRAAGLFTRPWLITESGQYVDERDGKPFSTTFSHSRFLTPILAKKEKADWALFCDCDFLFLDDVTKLQGLMDDRYAVMCVQHVHEPPEGVKMDGMAQTRYRRKNWSSFVLFNVKHRENGLLTHYQVNRQPGSWLHGFGWLEDQDIGELPAGWNHLVGSAPPKGAVHAVHFTEGMPNLPGYEHQPYADEWRAEQARMRL